MNCCSQIAQMVYRRGTKAQRTLWIVPDYFLRVLCVAFVCFDVNYTEEGLPRRHGGAKNAKDFICLFPQ